MNRIKNARFMRAVETDGKVTAEVEFSMDLGYQSTESSQDEVDQKYVAILENNGGPLYSLRQVYKNDSELALDWYDNAQHQAYIDVTNSMFGNSQLNMDRESFVLDVLDCEGVKKDMEGGGGGN